MISFRGKPISKKNALTPSRGKDGKMRLRYGKKREELDRLELQVPGELRDLGLVSPDVEFYFQAPLQNWDRDNAVVTLSDILVKYGVFANDSVAQFNGTITVHPCEVGAEFKTHVVIHPKEGS